MKKLILLLSLLWVSVLSAGTIIEKLAKIAQPFFILGASHEDGVGNASYLGSSIITRNAYCNGPTWAMILGGKQPLCQIGRYTPPGMPAPSWAPPTPLGRNYATGSASINSSNYANSSVIQQINLLLADYPSGLPSGSVVLIDVGINDITLQLTQNGQWTSAANSSWPVNGNQTFVTSGSTQVLLVTSTTGAAVGGSNFIAFPIHGGFSTLGTPIAITAVNPGVSISFVQPQPAWNGLQIDTGAIVTTYAQAGIASEMTALATPFANLAAAIATAKGTIIWVTPIDGQNLPGYSGQATLAHWTYLMFLNQIASIFAEAQVNVRQLDLNQICQQMVANPLLFGFKDYTTIWTSSSLSPSDVAWYQDGYHPTEAQMCVWANYAFEQFYRWGLLQDAVF